MTVYHGPLRDIRFVLRELLGIERYLDTTDKLGWDRETVDLVLEEGRRMAEEVLLPLNPIGDEEGCHFFEGEVTTPQGFKEAYDVYCKAGWVCLDGKPKYGGAGLPHAVVTAIREMMSSANMSFETYPGLTMGAAGTIAAHGDEVQRQMYLPKMYSGEWSGTMNLTESHSGSDLSLLRSRAEPQCDGSYLITGSKIYISAGDHDLVENIIHLVLARIPGAPEGIHGISLFIVPKFLVREDGSLGERNSVFCGSIENKMGLNASATCEMNYNAAIGYLLGERHQGVKAMFTMMNKARLAVAVQALSLGEIAYQNAAAFAKRRLQGRSSSDKVLSGTNAVPIIVHPDIRRMLMTMRTFTEGARALTLWTAFSLDMSENNEDARVRSEAADCVSLVTPILKAYITDLGFEITNLGLQIFGGSGYIRGSGMEQYVRDCRITQIYEGTNAIQALDLIGRQLSLNYGRSLRQVFHPISKFIILGLAEDDMVQFAEPLREAFGRLQCATYWVLEQSAEDQEVAAAVATNYLRMFGIVLVGFLWARTAMKALQMLAKGTNQGEFYRAKLATTCFFFEHMLPETSSLFVKIMSGKGSIMALDIEQF